MANKVAQSILDAIDSLVTLEIKTIIGEFTLDGKSDITATPGKSDEIVTRINLVQGDIRTAMSEKFLQPPYSELRAYHTKTEEKGHQIVLDNIKALKEMMNLVDYANGKANDTPPSNPTPVTPSDVDPTPVNPPKTDPPSDDSDAPPVG